MDFLYPSYYSAGAAAFAPGGAIEGVARWEDMAGKTVAVPQGYYVLEAAAATPALAGINFVVAANAEGGCLHMLCLHQLCQPPALLLPPLLPCTCAAAARRHASVPCRPSLKACAGHVPPAAACRGGAAD